MSTVAVCETFSSIQGESSYAGASCFFIRLSGCNLRCSYCDTAYAYAEGDAIEVPRLVEMARASNCSITEVTGGEPLLQKETPELVAGVLAATDRPVLVETNGSCDISSLPSGSIAVVDVKCPCSGAAGTFDMANLKRLRTRDEIKFVLSSRSDYDWAAQFVREHDLAAQGRNVFFSPVWECLEAASLADWIVADGIPVRLQVQLHKFLGTK